MKQFRCPSTDEWIRRCGVYITWNISHKKELNWVIYSEVDEPRVCNKEWKYVRKRKTKYHILM